MRLKSIHHLIIYSRNHSTTMNTIFTTDKNSRKRYIDIRVEERDGCWCIVKASGQVGGKESISVTEVPLGYESATKRAKTVWKNLNTKATTILPMLANKWEDRENYISEPFYVQPKIDGVRLLVSNKGGISRTGKLVPGTESLGKGLEEGQYLDGECYDHNLTFEEITSLFKTDPMKLKFYVFDYFDLNKLDMPFEERMKFVTVDTKLVQKKRQMPLAHKKYVQQGYEGTMIRDRKSVYEVGQRSNYLLKHKDFQTEEYEIVGATTGHGRDAKAVVWKCKTESGAAFNARPEGTIESREDKYARRDEFMGKMLTVRFQNLTNTGVPRFPIGVVVRDYE